jgi:Na+/H+-dicarboxylate symporter
VKKFSAPLLFLSVLILAILLGDSLPLSAKRFFYTLSLAIKELMIFVLPAVIFSLVFLSLSKIRVNVLKFLLLILPLICGSNFVNTLISYVLGVFCVQAEYLSSLRMVSHEATALDPLFSLRLPSLLSNDFALLAGVVCGMTSGTLAQRNPDLQLLGMRHQAMQEKISGALECFSKGFFKVLLPLMPIFMFGTTVKLAHDGMISLIVSEYLRIAGIFVLSAYGYVLLQLLVLSRFNGSLWMEYLRNLLPAAITGFGSMSSAAALPLSLKAAEKNSTNKENAAIIVPCTVNVHLVGDCFFIPFVALSILTSFGQPLPDFSTYLIFAAHFVIAKFAVAAVPGGGILVMLPILQAYLGLNSDMLGLITALYVLFDSFITCCNVAGNGAMAIIFDRIAGKS